MARLRARASVPIAMLLGLGLAGAAAAMVQHPNLERGFSADGAFQIGELDHVNLFNHGLSVTIPMGIEYPINGGFAYQLSLVYSSKVWDWETLCDDNVQPVRCQHQPRPGLDFNAGLGWMLSLGHVVPPGTRPRNETANWLYVGPDGAEHLFYSSLSVFGTGDPGVFYTRDNSYLRLRLVGGRAEIDFPDGTTHGFGSDHRLAWMKDAFDNQLTVTRTPTLWTLDDGHRQHRIRFASFHVDGELRDLVTRVELAAFGGGAPATYALTYQMQAVDRPDPYDPQSGTPNLPALPPAATVPILTKVTLPDGATYAMPRSRHNVHCPSDPQAACFDTGTIRRMTLPTLGHIEWTYARRGFPTGTALQRPMQAPPGQLFQWLTSPPGVATRKLLHRGGAVIGTWTYSQRLGRVGAVVGGFRDVESISTVIDAANNKTEHYFVTHRLVVTDGTEDRRRTEVYGLPYTPFDVQGAGTRRGFLSRVVFRGSGNTQQRSARVRYELDPGDGSETKLWDLNRRVVYEKTRYRDGSEAEVRRSDYDGLGHYRRIETLGNFGQGDRRTEHTNWNPGGSAPRPHERWLLGLYDETTQTEGALTERQTHCFDNRGYLARRRVFKNPAQPTADDVVVDMLRNGDGNTIRERSFGGDNRSVPTGSSLCGLSLDTGWEYQISHAYSSGTRKRSTYAGGVGFHHFDADVDPSTGLLAAQRDVSGQLRTAYEYDTLGRIRWIKPPVGHGSWVQYAYTPAHQAGDSKARVEIRRHRNNSTGQPFLQHERFVFDALGRLEREERMMPDATFASRDSTYHAMGWKTGVSEWRRGSSFVGWTRFLDFDPLGRPQRIEPPDGAHHAVEIAYGGIKTVSRTRRVRLSGNATSTPETRVTTTETYDRQGRLWKVNEPGNGLQATYRYDVGGRLIQADLWNGGSTTQRRSFGYDGRGFLTSECHPEKSGCVTYSRIDSRGHALERTDNGTTLRFAYDAAERLRSVARRISGGTDRVIKEFAYTSNNAGGNLRRGRLWKATRHNRGEAPWAPGTTGTISVTEEYFYEGRDGRVSKRNTTVGPDVRFSQRWDYDDLGNVVTLTYPRCTNSDCAGAGGGGPFRQQQLGYFAGRLRSISGFVDNITYHASGMRHQVSHANGTTYRVDQDASGLARPRDIRLTLGNGQTIAFGEHRYDGSGNLIVRGSEFFIYDHLSRIKRWEKASGRYQSYDHDSFGNLIGITHFDGVTTQSRTHATSAGTNRLSAAQYDGRGNVVAWGGEAYRWDDVDMLFQRDFPQDTYIYTADDERICKIWWDGTTIRETWTLRDLDNTILRLYARNVDRAASTVTWHWIQDSFHDDQGTMLFDVTSRAAPQRNLHHATDHLGSPLVTTDQNGNIFATDSLWAYGQDAGTSGPVGRRRFTGHERDYDLSGRATDLDYMHARSYSPWLGRFMSVDPARRSQDLAVPQSWNRYAYGLNGPLKFRDPDGEVPALVVAAAGGGAVDAGITVASNLLNGRRLLDGVGSSFVRGAAAGAAGFGVFKAIGRGFGVVKNLRTSARAARVRRSLPDPKVIREVKALSDDAILTSRQVKELEKNLDAVLQKSLPQAVQKGMGQSVVRLLQTDSRFRASFLKQVPGAKRKIEEALERFGLSLDDFKR